MENSSTSGIDKAAGFLFSLPSFNSTFHKDDKEKESATKNKLKNANAAGLGQEWSGKVVCKGNPQLRGMTVVTIAQGGGGSGNWYIKECKQSYQAGRSQGAYLTELQITRPGGDAKPGDRGNKPPPNPKGGS